VAIGDAVAVVSDYPRAAPFSSFPNVAEGVMDGGLEHPNGSDVLADRRPP
jgi:hypothetical protein